jgi:hypothetical protein
MSAFERAYARNVVARATTLTELEADAEVARNLSADWPAVRLEDIEALDRPTRPVYLEPELVRALDALARR